MWARFTRPLYLDMPFTIKRSWGVNYKSLLARPRISRKVSEYVFDFLNENLLKPNKVLQSDKYVYVFTLSFSTSIPKNRKFPFPYTSPYATETRLFFGQKGFRAFERIEKWATLSVLADDIDQTITPYEYALVVFKMFADFFLYNYKKFEKHNFDKLITELDQNHIESFVFPASFEDQQYSLDDIELPVIPLSEGHDWVNLGKRTKINPKVEYLKHYPF
jgi:hypothetical protein